jgi:hypothetical protein
MLLERIINETVKGVLCGALAPVLEDHVKNL